MYDKENNPFWSRPQLMREAVATSRPCPACEDWLQQQLVEYLGGEPFQWKCRMCKTRYETRLETPRND